jgi:hypothetical protein
VTEKKRNVREQNNWDSMTGMERNFPVRSKILKVC